MAFAAFIPFIIEAIPSLVKLVEKAFPKQDGQKTGETKQSAALEMVKQLLKKMKDQKILEDVPSDDAIRGMIDTIVSQLNATGEMTRPAPTGDLFIVRGTVTPIKG